MKNLLLLSLLIAAAVSCGRKSREPIVPSSEYAAYVSAYTGGMISTSGTVRVELVNAKAGVEADTPISEKLFSFSPSVKGQARLVNGNVVEFTPEEGALRSGTIYNVKFALGKVADVAKGFEAFEFSFRTKKQDFEVELDPSVISAENSAVMRQSGTILFGDAVDAATVGRMIRLDGDTAPALEPAKGKADRFRFTFDNLTRPSDEDLDMDLVVRGKEAGIERTEELEVVVPARGEFRVVFAGLLHDADGMYVGFSEPLERGQDLDGLISAEGIGEYAMMAEDNIVKIFAPNTPHGEAVVRVREGVRSAAGERLSDKSNIWFPARSKIEPSVMIVSDGVIMPDAQNLVLRFKAASLRAVDLRVIRIFENNVLMFLQTNKLTGNDELRRSGRLIYNKPLRLPGGNSNNWHDYAVDLAPIIKQEPGAIYRIELDMKLEYSTYPCGDDPAAVAEDPVQGLIELTAEASDMERETSWDDPFPWYYYWHEDYDDYDQYEWSERDDPCKPSYYMHGDRRAVINVLASNLGVIVKSGADRRAFVAVTDLLTTRPVAGASIKIYNFQLQPIGQGKTDAEGMAVVDVRGVGFAAVVEKDGSKSYVKMVDAEQNSLSRFDVGGKSVQRGLKGYVYGERGVWRPGDTLHLTLVLDDRLGRIPDNHPVTLELFNPRGQFHTRRVNPQGTNGFYVFNVPTSGDDPTGVWNAYFKVGGATFHKSLRIETIKPNRLKINLEIPNGRIEAADKTTASLSVSWLTGAVARDLKGSVEMNLVRGSLSPFKGFERFTFNDPASSFTSEKTEVWSGRVDGEGNARISIPSPAIEGAPGMMRADIVGRVFEPGGDASIFVESFPFSPFRRYVGVDVTQKPGEYFETNRDNMFDVVTVNSSGAAVNGTVEWKVYKMRWSWWWHKGDESLESYVNGNYADPVAEGTLTTVNGRGSFPLRVDYPEWGRYLIYVKDRDGGHASGGIVYFDWPSSYGRAQRTDPEGAAMLTFTLDRQSYEVGDMATVVIPESAGGRALVSFENGSTVLGSHWVDVSGEGDTRYTFKVTPEMAPNFYVHISLLQPHGQTVNSSPIRLYGIMPVEVGDKASVLEPVISAPEVLRPLTEFTVKVSEKKGAEMTYTLAVVDEGLLDLTNFKTPNAWNEFYAREALGVRTWDIYDYVMGAYGGAMGTLLGIGGDQALKPADRKANRFKPVVRFMGPFTVKKGSSNSHSITLPMYVGSVRVMVVAGNRPAYGSAEKSIPVRTPLMLLSTLPRVISIGEDITLPVNVFAMEEGVRDVTVRVEASGSASVSKEKTLGVSFSRPGDQMVRFNLRADDMPGVAKIKITASAGSHKASEEIEIAVRNPNPLTMTVTDTILKSGAAIKLPYSLGREPNEDNQVSMEVSGMPPVNLTRSYGYLDDYGHLCTEQLTSRGFPMLYLQQFREVDKKEAEKISKGVQAIINQIYGRQFQNGSFTYWPGNASANEWITSYAGNFLYEASQRGYDVDQGVIKRWKDYQRRAALNWSMPSGKDRKYFYYYQPDLVQAYRLYTLALAGAPETGAMNRMKETPGLSVAAKWRLAGAYAISGKQQAARQIVADAKTTVEDYTYGSGYTFGSAGRDAAMILETMVYMDDMTAAMRQAKVVSERLGNETYLSTQSTAFALIAMGTLASKIDSKELAFTFTLDGKDHKINSSEAVFQTILPVTAGSGEVAVTSRSGGDLFVTLTCRTRPLVDTRPAMSSNLSLSVEYRGLDGSRVDPSQLDQGSDFHAVVTVANTSGTSDYTDIALTHIMPSGWEIFNERMAVSDEAMAADQERDAQEEDSDVSRYASRTAPAFNYQDIRDDRVLTYFDLRRGERKTITVRLQAAYAGSFTLPAIECEAMYDPVVRARTAAGTAVVK